MQRFDATKIGNMGHSVWARRHRLTERLEWRKFQAFFLHQRLSAFLLLIGTGILGYVGSEYWAMYHEQKVLQREWQEQQKNTASTKTNVKAIQDDGLTRVSIPKINLDVIVVEGTNHRALRVGPGHLKSTPAPGELGNSVISAHRDTFFRHIYELAKGDEIQVRRGGRTYTFQVTGKKIVEPSDISVLRSSPDARLTLITCYPTYYIGPAPQRLIVFSKLVSDSGTGAQQAQTASATAGRQGS
ncbi:MAG TPA: class D sortase [Terriglobales bacterium]|nr:class D sortase [Terriglobales bacterium]